MVVAKMIMVALSFFLILGEITILQFVKVQYL